jgi:AcrR family transcriptional regulator
MGEPVAGADVPSGGALRLVLAAERLFALHGVEGVSLRQIGAEAGFANNSAVHYHFGSKDGLVEAILRHRLPQLISERRLLAAQCDPGDVRSRFGAHYLPVLNMAEMPDNHYVTFIEQLQRRHLAAGDTSLPLPEEGSRSDEEFRRDLMRLLPDLDEELRRMRIVEAQLLCIHAAVDREHAVASGAELPPFELFVSSLLDGITGFLGAPVSGATRQRLQASDHIAADDRRLL